MPRVCYRVITVTVLSNYQTGLHC